MKNLINLSNLPYKELKKIFSIADLLQQSNNEKCFNNKSFVMFFPETSIRTRVTFEKGIYELGGQSILFPITTLEKKESLEDIIGYLNNWADCIILRYNDISLINKVAEISNVPVINALSNVNHPCEVIADLYSITKLGYDIQSCKYLYVGVDGNIGKAWKEAAHTYNLQFMHCAPEKYKIKDVDFESDLNKAIIDKDIVITDALPQNAVEDFKAYQINESILKLSGKKVAFNPCPPFFRNEEVSVDAIESSFFVGYEFKKNLLNVQQAILKYCLNIK